MSGLKNGYPTPPPYPATEGIFDIAAIERGGPTSSSAENARPSPRLPPPPRYSDSMPEEPSTTITFQDLEFSYTRPQPRIQLMTPNPSRPSGLDVKDLELCTGGSITDRHGREWVAVAPRHGGRVTFERREDYDHDQASQCLVGIILTPLIVIGFVILVIFKSYVESNDYTTSSPYRWDYNPKPFKWNYPVFTMPNFGR